MAELDVVDAALVRAWGAYRMIHSGTEENDDRREKLRDFMLERWQAGIREGELLAVEGLKFLKTLDGSPTG